jgi:SAM-dependent methyltransferase
MGDVDTGSSEYLRRAYDLGGSPRAAAALYDEWAETYEAETADAMGYVAPTIAAEKLAAVLDDRTAPVLDAGCGTGLVGAELSRLGFEVLDGYDISDGMLDKARSGGHYRQLQRVDLSDRLPAEDASYAAVVCVGTLTEGHVGPEALAEFVRVTRPGGIVIATIIDAIWEEQGYRAAVDVLVEQGRATLLEAEIREYRTRQNVGGRLPVLQVTTG